MTEETFDSFLLHRRPLFVLGVVLVGRIAFAELLVPVAVVVSDLAVAGRLVVGAWVVPAVAAVESAERR